MIDVLATNFLAEMTRVKFHRLKIVKILLLAFQLTFETEAGAP